MLGGICPQCRIVICNRILSQYYVSYAARPRVLQYVSTSGNRYYSQPINKKSIDMSRFPVENIRNFSIIAHIDHGKSTLADRLLELTGTISASDKNKQVLDKLQVERERGITVKAQSASLIYNYNNNDYLLNLIDTPGHVDFNYEVARSLSACQGVILLVDANQGVQAQTVANFFLAFEANLSVIPVMNKIDLKVARPNEVAEQIRNAFDMKNEDILRISAKLGTGVEDVLKAVIEKIPPPTADRNQPLKVLLYDSWYDRYRGVAASVAITNGFLKKGDRVESAHLKKSFEVQELGIMYPDETNTGVLYAGQVGYMYAGMKNVNDAQVGDTLYHPHSPVEPHKGFKQIKPMVYAGIFPMDQSEYTSLRNALNKLTLNDSSVEVNPDSSAALGQGWRLGFLGLLHLDVFSQRLEQEYNASVIVTSPNVPYKVKIHGARNIKFYGSTELTILNPCHLPDRSIIIEYQEPWVRGTVISPDTYLGDIMGLIMERRAQNIEHSYIDNSRLMITADMPLNEILVDFFDKLKSKSSGYASFDYEDTGYRPSDLARLDFFLNGREVEELAQVVHVTQAREIGKHVVARLKETLPAQLFEIAIQAKVGAKVMARENIKAYRKDVTAKLYGGDVTRRKKLLKRQAEGKKRMRMVGNIEVPKDTFIKVLQR